MTIPDQARARCATPCPRHDHRCDRSPSHCGPCRDVKQKGTETCSWEAAVLRDQIRDAFGPHLMSALSGSAFYGPSGEERLAGWMEWITDAVMGVVTAEVERLTGERDDVLADIENRIRRAADRDATTTGSAYHPTYARGIQAGYERALRIIQRARELTASAATVAMPREHLNAITTALNQLTEEHANPAGIGESTAAESILAARDWALQQHDGTGQ